MGRRGNIRRLSRRRGRAQGGLPPRTFVRENRAVRNDVQGGNGPLGSRYRGPTRIGEAAEARGGSGPGISRARLHRLKAGLDSRDPAPVCMPGQGKRADMPEIDLCPPAPDRRRRRRATHAIASWPRSQVTRRSTRPRSSGPAGRRLGTRRASRVAPAKALLANRFRIAARAPARTPPPA